tara:strand:+ start:610 stop:1245 length:636 start_codon:yes stop_codon:yes gene_type:complete
MNNDILDGAIAHILEEAAKKRERVKSALKVIDGAVYPGAPGLNTSHDDDGWDGVKPGDFGLKTFDFSKRFKKIIRNEARFNCMLIAAQIKPDKELKPFPRKVFVGELERIMNSQQRAIEHAVSNKLESDALEVTVSLMKAEVELDADRRAYDIGAIGEAEVMGRLRNLVNSGVFVLGCQKHLKDNDMIVELVKALHDLAEKTIILVSNRTH